ncbi:hypothetical protein HY643_03185, partial [Candidatus Woesearchaeota archaeon]|nr:hypothetical protein [Candidatus Woesearchaeota archaeon]
MPEIITPELVYQTIRRINSEFAGYGPEFTLHNRTIKFNLPDRGIKKTTFKKIIELAKQNNLISKKGVKLLKKRKEYFTFKCGQCNQ